MAKYYKSKGDRAMTDLSEAYGQIVTERRIASYEGGTQREVVQEIAPLFIGGARVAAKLAPKIVKGAKALMPGAKAAAKQIGGAAVAGAAQGVQQRVQNKVAGQPQPQQEQEEEFNVGVIVDIDERLGGGTGEIIGILSTPEEHFTVQTEEDEILQVHQDDLTLIQNVNVEDEPGTWTAGRVGV